LLAGRTSQLNLDAAPYRQIGFALLQESSRLERGEVTLDEAAVALNSCGAQHQCSHGTAHH
jgi:hypothetical protein